MYAQTSITQTPFSIHLSTQQGLPSNNVYDLLQDKKGFIWMATDNGLCRYDGANFKSYACSNMSSKSGSYIKEDTWGRIWYANFDGSIFYIEHDSMKAFGNQLNATPEYALLDSSLWMVANNNLIQYNLLNAKEQSRIHINPIRYVFQKNNNIELIDFYGNYISYYNKKGIQYAIDSLPAENCFKVLEYHQTNYFIRETKTELQINTLQNKVFSTILKIPKTGQITGADIMGHVIWIATKSGIHLYDLETQQRTYFLEHEIVSHVIKDIQGNLWMSTMNGVFIFPSKTIQHNYAISSNSCKLKTIDKQLFLLDAQGTFSTFDESLKKVVPIYQDPNRQALYEIYFHNPNSTHVDFSKTNRQHFSNVISYKGGSYELFNPGCKDYAVLNEKYMAVALSGAMNIIQNSEIKTPNVWDSLCLQYAYQNQQHENLKYVSSFFENQRVKSVAFDSTNQLLYCATNSGMKIVSPKKVDILTNKGSSIYADKVVSEDSKTLILTTNGELLYKNGLQEIESLSNLNIVAPFIQLRLVDKTLILRNKQQIYYLPLKQLNAQISINEFSILNVVTQMNEINDVTLIDSTFYITTPHNLIECNSSNQTQKNHYSFYIDAVHVGNKLVKTQGLQLSSSQHDISLDFSIIDYLQNPKDIQYQLNNEDWKRLDPLQRRIEFASLSAGIYIIRFKVNGQLETATVEFTIAKPWYLQAWFLGLCILAIAWIIYLFFKLRLDRNKKQNKLLLEKAMLEKDLRQSMLSSIKAQMNPHFLFNALNTIQSYIITEDKENASNYLSKFSKLTRKILDMSDKETITLQEELDALMLYVELEKMRFNDLNFTIEFDKQVHAHELLIPSMIIQPYVENAIKHGLLHKVGEKHLFIKINQSATHLHIQIEDNGIGRKRSEEINKNKFESHRSFASDANLKRIELLNSEKNQIGIDYIDKVDDEGNACGTLVNIKIPLKTKL